MGMGNAGGMRENEWGNVGNLARINDTCSMTRCEFHMRCDAPVSNR